MVIARFFVVAAIFAFIIFAHSADGIYQAVIVFGQAHFLMAYYYQYKTGKINLAYVLRYFLVGFFVFGSYYFFESSVWPNFLAGAYFVIHFLYDERYLLAEKTSFIGWLRLSPIIVACFPGNFSLLNIDIYDEAQFILLVIVSGIILAGIVKRVSVSQTDLYFISVFSACYMLSFSEWVPNAGQATSFIVLAHYAHWYINYLIKFKSSIDVRNRFLLEIFAFNFLMASLFVLYLQTGGHASSKLKYFFGGDFFSMWTIMHYFVTFRAGDLNNWVPDCLQKNKGGMFGLWRT